MHNRTEKLLGKFPKALYGTTGDTCRARFFCPVVFNFPKCVSFVVMLVTAVSVLFLRLSFLFQVFCPGVFCFRVSGTTF